MADLDKKAAPECFARLERVFPMGPDGLRHTPPGCLDCDDKTECLRAAVAGEQGLAVHEERLKRAYQAGRVGFMERWAQQKTLQGRKIPITATREKIYSEDRNLWHLSHEGGILEDPWNEPDEGMYVLTVSPEKAPDQPQWVEIEFERGWPVAVDGQHLGPARLVEILNKIGGIHSIGRIDLVENRLVGMKSRGVYETPGGTLLLAALRELESLTLDRTTLHYKDIIAGKYAELVYNGQWFTPLRNSMDAFVDCMAGCDRVAGMVRGRRVRSWRGGTRGTTHACHLPRRAG